MASALVNISRMETGMIQIKKEPADILETLIVAIKRHSEFEQIGRSAFVAEIQNQEAKLSLSWIDFQGAENTNLTDSVPEGTLPETGNSPVEAVRYQENTKINHAVREQVEYGSFRLCSCNLGYHRRDLEEIKYKRRPDGICVDRL